MVKALVRFCIVLTTNLTLILLFKYIGHNGTCTSIEHWYVMCSITNWTTVARRRIVLLETVVDIDPHIVVGCAIHLVAVD